MEANRDISFSLNSIQWGNTLNAGLADTSARHNFIDSLDSLNEAISNPPETLNPNLYLLPEATQTGILEQIRTKVIDPLGIGDTVVGASSSESYQKFIKYGLLAVVGLILIAVGVFALVGKDNVVKIVKTAGETGA